VIASNKWASFVAGKKFLTKFGNYVLNWFLLMWEKYYEKVASRFLVIASNAHHA